MTNLSTEVARKASLVTKLQQSGIPITRMNEVFIDISFEYMNTPIYNEASNQEEQNTVLVILKDHLREIKLLEESAES